MLEVLSKKITARPQDFPILLHLGETFHAQGQRQMARQVWSLVAEHGDAEQKQIALELLQRQSDTAEPAAGFWQTT